MEEELAFFEGIKHETMQKMSMTLMLLVSRIAGMLFSADG